MPEKAAPFGGQADGPAGQADPGLGEDDPGEHREDQRDDIPEVEAGPADDPGLPPGPDRGGLGELVGGVAPRAVEQPLEQEQGDRVEQQGCHDLVDAAADPQHGGDEPHAAPATAPATRPSGSDTTSGSAGKARVTAVTAIAPAMNCPLAADVVVAGPEGDQRGQPGEDQWRARQEDLKHGV